jgi:hypothetical protein
VTGLCAACREPRAVSRGRQRSRDRPPSGRRP